MPGKVRGVVGVAEVVALLALTFSPVYLATFVIGWLNPTVTRGLSAVWAVCFFLFVPVIWIVVSELSSIPARIIAATLLRGRPGTRYLGEFLGNCLCVLYLMALNCLYFSRPSAAFAAAALACLVYKATEPVCYRLFPALKEPAYRKECREENRA